jgi:hypothetical protein
VLLLAAAAVACGGSEMSNQEVAADACGLLAGWTDDVGAAANAAQDGLVEGADVRAVMLDVLDDILDRTDELVEAMEGLDHPDTDGGRAFAEVLRTGAEAARADIAGFREEVEAIPDPDPERVPYRRAQLVVELEKPRSLVKPDVQGDLGDAELEAAITDEESCRFVTRTQ